MVSNWKTCKTNPSGNSSAPSQLFPHVLDKHYLSFPQHSLHKSNPQSLVSRKNISQKFLKKKSYWAGALCCPVFCISPICKPFVWRKSLFPKLGLLKLICSQTQQSLDAVYSRAAKGWAGSAAAVGDVTGCPIPCQHSLSPGRAMPVTLHSGRNVGFANSDPNLGFRTDPLDTHSPSISVLL